MPYAIIRTGGKQYRVSAGDKLRIEKVDVPAGGDLALSDVLAVGEGAALQMGAPLLDGQAVQAKVLRHGRGAKILIQTYKRRKGFQKRKGHRQDFTEVQILSIPGGPADWGEPAAAQ